MAVKKRATKAGYCNLHRCPIIPVLGRCLKCEETAQQSSFERSLAEHEELEQALYEYQGDAFLVDSYMADGMSLEDAIADVQSPASLEFYLNTPYPYKDRHFREGLGTAILRRDPLVSRALAERDKPAKKRGTKVDPKTGKHKSERVTELTIAGKTDSQIAKEMTGNPNKASLVTAIRDQDQKRLGKAYGIERPKQRR